MSVQINCIFFYNHLINNVAWLPPFVDLSIRGKNIGIVLNFIFFILHNDIGNYILQNSFACDH